MTADDKARRTGKDICDQHCVIGYYTRDGSRALEADIDAALEAVRAEALEEAAKIVETMTAPNANASGVCEAALVPRTNPSLRALALATAIRARKAEKETDDVTLIERLEKADPPDVNYGEWEAFLATGDADAIIAEALVDKFIGEWNALGPPRLWPSLKMRIVAALKARSTP